MKYTYLSFLFLLPGLSAQDVGVMGQPGIGTNDPDEVLHINGGNVRIDRGSEFFALTRYLSIGGARNGAGHAFSQIRFMNYDNNSDILDTTWAMISSNNTNSN